MKVECEQTSSKPPAIAYGVRRLRSILVAASVALGVMGAAAPPGSSQTFGSLKTPETPLVLKSRGSFFVNGEISQQDRAQLGELGPDDQITINQMYVEYMVPVDGNKVPVVLLHGATLSGKTYDTTPDGRMGWFEYFVRQGFPVYVPDQVGRARSGFDQKVFNNARNGIIKPSDQPSILRLGDKFGAWQNFRFGPSPGVAFPNVQFPIEAAWELSKQSIPDLNRAVPSPNPTFKALADLSRAINGSVLIGHSQGGRFPTEAALADPGAFKGLVLVEPGICNSPSGPTYTDEQIAKLAVLPILIVFGDNLASPTGVPGPTWQERFNDCASFIARIAAAKGKAEMLYPPKLGILGNTHMIMQDKNNLVIADLIIKWINVNVK